MKQSSLFPIKARDILIGFCGWAIFHNICYLAWQILFGIVLDPQWMGEINIIFGGSFLAFGIGFIFLLVKKNIWIGLGSLLAIIVSGAIWRLIVPGLLINKLGLMIIFIPFPLGLTVLPPG
jgi:hypothetical protein